MRGYTDIGGRVLRTEDIIAVCDLDKSTISHRTREFLNKAQKDGEVEIVAEDIPVSMVICREGEDQRIYLSRFTPETLRKR